MNMTRTSRSAVLAVALAATAGLSACGGTSSSSGNNPSATASQTPATAGATPSAGPTTPKGSPGPRRPRNPCRWRTTLPATSRTTSRSSPTATRPGGYSFTHPEGWARTLQGVRVRFTDKLNGVAVESLPATTAPTVASARTNDVPRLRAAVPAFQLRAINP